MPRHRAEAGIKTLKLFMKEPSLPKLRFRPFKGLDGIFIINVKHGDRIILVKIDNENFIAADIGPHDNVYRKWNRKK